MVINETDTPDSLEYIRYDMSVGSNLGGYPQTLHACLLE